MGLRYLKTAPTDFVRHYVRGRLVREGTGLSFFYFGPTSMLVKVPAGSADAPFVFHEATADFQTLTVQGQITYAVADPRKAAALLDFHLDARGAWASEDPALLPQRLVQEAQVIAKRRLQVLKLREALGASGRLQTELLEGLRGAESVTQLGLEILGVALLEMKPTPEMARALEAEAREELQRRADGAVYQRRNSAVEQERIIKENELNTEIAVEEKRRTIRETQVAADIAIEERRKQLIVQRVENERQEADARGYALDAVFKPLKGVDWKVLLAASGGGLDPKLMIALAFRELAENAGKIGELNISPDLLQSLIGKGRGDK